MSEEERQELQQLFRSFDADNSGHISVDELAKVPRANRKARTSRNCVLIVCAARRAPSGWSLRRSLPLHDRRAAEIDWRLARETSPCAA